MSAGEYQLVGALTALLLIAMAAVWSSLTGYYRLGATLNTVTLAGIMVTAATVAVAVGVVP